MKTAIELIREEYPTRPDLLLRMEEKHRPVLYIKDRRCCPLGLLKNTDRHFPGMHDLPDYEIEEFEIQDFYRRWDNASIEEAEGILDEIWPDGQDDII